MSSINRLQDGSRSNQECLRQQLPDRSSHMWGLFLPYSIRMRLSGGTRVQLNNFIEALAPFGLLTPFSVNQDGLLIASGNEWKPDLVCRHLRHLFFFSQMECVANVEKLGHCTCGSEFSDLLKNYWIWHHWLLISWSWQWRTAFHLTQGWALQLPVGPPAPTVLQPAPHAPSSNLPPLIM